MPDRFQSLVEAILRDDCGRVKALLKEDAGLAQATATNARYEPGITHWIYTGDTALHVAAAGHRVEIVKTLLAAGADPSAAQNHRRSQPLHYAADGHVTSDSWNPRQQVRTIELLLKAGGDLQARDKNGATPLHRAVRTRCASAVQCLLDAGSNATLRNKPGSTAFHLAVQNTGRGGSGAEPAKAAQREILRAFLARGVRPSLRDAKGKSVLEWAKSGWIRELLAAETE